MFEKILDVVTDPDVGSFILLSFKLFPDKTAALPLIKCASVLCQCQRMPDPLLVRCTYSRCSERDHLDGN